MISNSGIGVYTSALLNAVNSEDSISEITLGGLSRDKSKYESLKKIKFIAYDAPIYSIAEQLKGFFLDRKISNKVDLCHFSHYNKSLFTGTPYVVTIHDTIMFQYGYGNSLKRKIAFWVLKKVVLGAEKVVCISNTTKKNLLQMIPELKVEKTVVIYNPVGVDNLKNHPSDLQELYHQINDEYILCVGNRKKHKNFEIVINAMDKLKSERPNLKLVLIGGRDSDYDDIDKLISELKLSESVVQIINANPSQIIDFYKNAELVISPSLLEGFGFIPFESISMGKLPLLSDIEINHELFGEDAVYFNQNDADDLTKRILYFLSHKNEATNLVDGMKKYLSIYGFERFRTEIIKLYSEVGRSLAVHE